MRHTDDQLSSRRPARARGLTRLLLVAAGLAALSGAPASAAYKALVIGNSSYARAADLPNPRNDAADVAARLAALGFTIAGGGPGLDLTREQMLDAVDDFSLSLRDGDLAVFYFAGHGAQSDGESYLIPSDDQDIAYSNDLRSSAYSAGALLAKLNGRPGVTTVFILDACRNNPLPRRTPERDGGAVVGLAGMEPSGSASSVIILATEKGLTASDGEGRNSRFTSALLAALERPERPLDDIVQEVTASVRQASDGTQRPSAVYSTVADIYLVPVADTTIADARVAEPPPPPPRGALVVDGGALNPVTPLVAGFLPDPQRLSVLAGGNASASAVAAGCPGAVSRWPTAILDYEAGDYDALHISASSEADTTLLVRDPAGRWSCNDDRDGRNPYLTIEEPATGSYRIWVGVFDPSAPAAGAELRISEHGLVVDGGAINAPIALTSGFLPDPMTLPTFAGGPVNAAMAEESCAGFIAPWPDFAIDYEAGRYPLHFSAASEGDAILVVRDPAGGFSCTERAGGAASTGNPAVTFAEPLSGRYRVWIGVRESGAGYPRAELFVSERDEPWF